MQRSWVVSPDYRSAIEAVKAARVAAGIGQRELARRLGKPPSFVNKIEILERRLDLLEFIAIALAIGVEPSVLAEQVRRALPEEVKL